MHFRMPIRANRRSGLLRSARIACMRRNAIIKQFLSVSKFQALRYRLVDVCTYLGTHFDIIITTRGNQTVYAHRRLSLLYPGHSQALHSNHVKSILSHLTHIQYDPFLEFYIKG